jgi:hypothetical protein
MQIFFGEASIKLAAQGVQSQPLIFLALQAEFQPLDEIKTDQSLPSKLLYNGRHFTFKRHASLFFFLLQFFCFFSKFQQTTSSLKAKAKLQNQLSSLLFLCFGRWSCRIFLPLPLALGFTSP